MEHVSQRHVLLVDDEPAVRDGVGQALESAGYSVNRCRDGLDAISWLEDNPAPHLLIGDVHMPGIGGYELRVRARARSIGTSRCC